MLKIKKADLVFILLIIFMIIPITRNFIQQSIYKIIGKFNPIEVVDISEQKKIEEYSGVLYAVNKDETIPFSNLKGKIILINFWATWCPPCVAEMSSLQSLYTNFKNDVEFLFISNEDPEELKTFLQENNYNFPIYIPTEGLPNTLEHKSIPSTFIINKEGNAVVEKNGAADWNTKCIHNILNSLITE